MNRNARTALPVLVVCLAIGFAHTASAGVAPDGDDDGIPDVLDKCTLDSRNSVAPGTCDTDCDGYGNVCDADFNQDGLVTPFDFSFYFVPAFKGQNASPWPQGMDMNCDGIMLPNDFSQYFVPKFKGANGGPIPGPSGVSCAGQPNCGCP
jgi:hypothetical protein